MHSLSDREIESKVSLTGVAFQAKELAVAKGQLVSGCNCQLTN